MPDAGTVTTISKPGRNGPAGETGMAIRMELYRHETLAGVREVLLRHFGEFEHLLEPTMAGSRLA